MRRLKDGASKRRSSSLLPHPAAPERNPIPHPFSLGPGLRSTASSPLASSAPLFLSRSFTALLPADMPPLPLPGRVSMPPTTAAVRQPGPSHLWDVRVSGWTRCVPLFWQGVFSNSVSSAPFSPLLRSFPCPSLIILFSPARLSAALFLPHRCALSALARAATRRFVCDPSRCLPARCPTLRHLRR